MKWTLQNIIVVVIITIVGIVIIISLFGPKVGLLNVAAKMGTKMGEWFIPTKPPEKLKPTIEADIPEELKKSYFDLIDAMNTKEEDCFVKFDIFPDKFEGYKIRMYENDDGIFLSIYEKKEKQTLLPKEVDNKFCYYNVIEKGTKWSLEGPNDFEEIGRMGEIEEGDFEPVIIQNNEYIVLYKGTNACFLNILGDCVSATDCFQLLMFVNEIDFCDESESYKDTFKDVLYKGTYYGNVGDWRFVKENNKWYYKLPSNEKIAYLIRIQGISNSDFKKIFDISKEVEHPSEESDGVWYKGIYYGSNDWAKYSGKEKWYYVGYDEGLTVDEKFKYNSEQKGGIDSDLKEDLFGN